MRSPPVIRSTRRDRLAAGLPVGPAADDGREQARAAAGVDEQQPARRGTSGSVASRRRSGTPSAMPPAPRTISLPGELQVGVQISSSTCSSIQPASANTRACSGPTTRMASKPSGSFGCCTVRRHAANVRASGSGVARLLVDDAARALAGEERDASTCRRERRARPASGAHGEPSSSSAKQNDELARVAVRGAVDAARPPAADVADDELQRPADREVGSVALAEHVHAAVHPDRLADRARCTIDAPGRPASSWPARRGC